MESKRRRGVEGSATRAALIDAAERLVREEGYAALTSRTLADKLNLSRQIVHYYFKSIDEVFIALVQQGGARTIARLEAAMVSKEPLRAAWEIFSDPDQAGLMLEIHALAHRRPAVRAEVKRFAEQSREMLTHAFTRHLEERGIEPTMRPIVAIVILTCVSQILALEHEIDITMGHKEMLENVDLSLRMLAEWPNGAPANVDGAASRRTTGAGLDNKPG